MKGQLSAEMLIVLVIILGLAAILASVMLKSAGKAAGAVEQKTETIINASNAGAAKAASGEYCVVDADCELGSCDVYSNRCN
ncbi:Uncharacterised protein [uncultured archaeon]|nr:Uncharacterised protein [uncultured archaeon]